MGRRAIPSPADLFITMENPLPPCPPRQPSPGFVCLPPWRVQGVSIAGEATCVHIPELDLIFDIGCCPRFALSASTLALTHGHMDHAAQIAYWFSQRNFLGAQSAKVACHPKLAESVERLMQAWVGIERQKTPYEIISLLPGEEMQLKGNMFLRAFDSHHCRYSLGYTVVEKRSKLLPELVGVHKEELIHRKESGLPITQILEIPQVCFTGDTCWGDHLCTDQVLKARILITECTFIEDEHDDRADIGRHMHLDDVVRLIHASEAEHIVLTHLSRRTHIPRARDALRQRLSEQDQNRVHLLMDHVSNKARYEALAGRISETE